MRLLDEQDMAASSLQQYRRSPPRVYAPYAPRATSLEAHSARVAQRSAVTGRRRGMVRREERIAAPLVQDTTRLLGRLLSRQSLGVELGRRPANVCLEERVMPRHPHHEGALRGVTGGMSDTRSRLQDVHAQSSPFATKTLQEARDALNANLKVAQKILRDVMPAREADVLSSTTVDTIGSTLFDLLKEAEKDGAHMSLEKLIQAYLQCLKEAAQDEAHDKHVLQKCCEEHLKFSATQCVPTAEHMATALQELRHKLRSPRVYSRIVEALFAKPAGTNWAKLVAASLVSAGAMAGMMAAHRYRGHKRAQEAQEAQEAIERALHERLLVDTEKRKRHLGAYVAATLMFFGLAKLLQNKMENEAYRFPLDGDQLAHTVQEYGAFRRVVRRFSSGF